MPRVMEIVTPLGGDVLLFHTMHAHEQIGRLSEFQLELLSKEGTINLDKILGQSVTVRLMLPEDKVRYFNGYVTRFAQVGMAGRYHKYAATVRPWLWFLSRTSDCRIFQDMTVPEIVKKVFTDHGTADVKWELTATYRKWTYCVQYRETDLNFVCRLLEHEGIYFYFTHDDGRHTLVITDSVSGHAPFPGYETIRVILPDQTVRADLEHISNWEFARHVQPGVYVHDDYDLERPSVELRVQKAVPRQYTPSSYEVFDFPGCYLQKPDGEQYAAVRIDEFAAQFERAQAVTNARGAAVGCLFNLATCQREDQNREHLIVEATHELEYSQYEALPEAGPAEYRCHFSAMWSRQQFRPVRSTPKPFVQGPQTAVVVGPAGDEIYTDKYGRVKVQFHWDRRGKKDQDSSCWIRVSHPWAGKAWGGVAIPRIGQEVIVDFLEGDPDQPLITGRVYNAEQMPPYALPANMTQTGIKSRSTAGGSPDNFNEIRFEDKKGSEQVYIHAEKNQDIVVESSETHAVGYNRKKTIGHDETTHVKHDRTETVDNNEKVSIGVNRTETVGGSHSEEIGGTMSVTVKLAKNEMVYLASSEEVGLARNLTVGAAYTIEVVGAMNEAVGAAKLTEVGLHHYETVGRDRKLNVGKKLTIDATDEIEMKSGGTSLVMKKDGNIVLKTGAASLSMKQDGKIEIAGVDVTLKSSAGTINIDAGGIISIKGPMVKINT